MIVKILNEKEAIDLAEQVWEFDGLEIRVRDKEGKVIGTRFYPREDNFCRVNAPAGIDFECHAYRLSNGKIRLL